jgi:hypothetical protein
MKNFEQSLNNLSMYVDSYDSVSLNDGEQMSQILQKLTVTLFYLETERSAFKKQYEQVVYDLTSDKKLSVARALNIAEVQVPELYMMRRIMDSAYRVCDAIRTNISFLKNERNQTRQ